MAFVPPLLLVSPRRGSQGAPNARTSRCSAPPAATEPTASRRSALAAVGRAVAAAVAATVAASLPAPPLPAVAALSPAPPAFAAGTPTAELPGAPPLTYQDLFVPSASGGAGLRRDIVSGSRVIVHYRVSDVDGAVLVDTRSKGAPTSVVAAADGAGGGDAVGESGGGLGVPVAVYRGLVGMRTGGRRLVSGTAEAVWGPGPGGGAGAAQQGPLWLEVSVLKVTPAPVPAAAPATAVAP